SKIADGVKKGWCIREEIGAAWLAINQQTLTSDLHIEPVHRDLELAGQFGWAEECVVMLPSVALGSHLDGSGTAEPPNGDGQHLIGAMGRAVAFVGKDRGDLVVGDAVAGKRQQALPHFRTSRQSGD